MKTHISLMVSLILLAGALILAACGDDPDPILVYVTPTPPVAATATGALLAADSQTTLIDAPRAQTTPQPTVPGVHYGPITGPNYTPEPRYTPLPNIVSAHPCVVTVVTAQQTLYQAPDAGSAALGAAFEREALAVSAISTDAAGTVWAGTERGWVPLQVGAAQLSATRACDELRGVTPKTTLLGLHVLNGTSKDTVLNFVRRMVQAGRPVGTIKGLTGAEEILNEVERLSPQTVTVYRSLLNGDGFGDCPANVREEPDPVETARRWMAGLEPFWSQVNADFYEYANECPVRIQWTAAFAIEAMKIANEQGRCLLLFSFPGGVPELAEFDILLPAYQYALDHPCQPGRTHGIALHAYSMEDTRLLSETDTWIARRHEIIYERLLATLPAATTLPVYITEAGIGGGTVLPPCEIIIRDALQYTYQLEESPSAQGFHLWSVGSGTSWYDITACLPALSDALIVYYQGGG
jgi:hypothetical protein